MENRNIYSSLIALNGSPSHVISKAGLSVPELALLRQLHGAGSVTEITLTGKEKYDSDSERERLNKIYREEQVVNLFGPYGELPLDVKKLKIESACFKKGDPINVLPKKESKEQSKEK